MLYLVAMNFAMCFDQLPGGTSARSSELEFMTKYVSEGKDSHTIEQDVKYCSLLCNLSNKLWNLRKETTAVTLPAPIVFQVYEGRNVYETDCYWLELISRSAALANSVIKEVAYVLRLDSRLSVQRVQDIEANQTIQLWSVLRRTIGIVHYVKSQAIPNCVWHSLVADSVKCLMSDSICLRAVAVWVAAIRSPPKDNIELLSRLASASAIARADLSSTVCTIIDRWATCDFLIHTSVLAELRGKAPQALCLLEQAVERGWDDTDKNIARLTAKVKDRLLAFVTPSQPSMREFDPVPNPDIMKYGVDVLSVNRVF